MTLIRVEHRDAVAVVTLDDPDRRNVLSEGLIGELVAAFDQLEDDDEVGAVVLAATPPAFCAGADLGDLASVDGDRLRAIYEGFLRVARSPLPTVAAVAGAAVGAGVNLALCCDIRLAAPSARFDARFLTLGLHPGGGHTWMLRGIAGPQAAAAMVLFGEVLDGEEAAAAGLAWRCVPAEDLLDRAVSLASRAARIPTALAASAKSTIADMAAIGTHPDAVERELLSQVWSVGQPWFRERITAAQAQVTGR